MDVRSWKTVETVLDPEVRKLVDEQDDNFVVSPDNRLTGARAFDKKHLLMWKTTQPNSVWKVDPHLDLISQDWYFVTNRTIDIDHSIRDARSGRVLLTFVAAVAGRDPEWMAYMPDGSFAGSVNCRKIFSPRVSRLRRRETHVEELLGGIVKGERVTDR
jgi:hypothetical protein